MRKLSFRVDGLTGEDWHRSRRPWQPATVLLLAAAILVVFRQSVGPDVSLVSELFFGHLWIGTGSSEQNILLRNSDSSALHVTNVVLSGKNAVDFLLTGDRCTGATIEPGGSCSIALRFQPRSLGERAASVTITDDVRDSPHPVALRGTGTGSALVPIDMGRSNFKPSLPAHKMSRAR